MKKSAKDPIREERMPIGDWHYWVAQDYLL